MSDLLVAGVSVVSLALYIVAGITAGSLFIMKGWDGSIDECNKNALKQGKFLSLEMYEKGPALIADGLWPITLVVLFLASKPFMFLYHTVGKIGKLSQYIALALDKEPVK